jgi:uncharacterized protein YjiS (DUF1127 family)
MQAGGASSLHQIEETAMSARFTTQEWTSTEEARKPSRIEGLFAFVKREIEIRRALRAVGSLDEAALHDIGIGPGNIEDAVRCGRH